MSVTVAPAIVAAAERALLAAEGPYHVARRYIADASLAARERRREAERQVAATARLAMPCPWCEMPLGAEEGHAEIGGRRLHAPCADAFDRHAYGEQAADTFAPFDESDVAVIEAAGGVDVAAPLAFLDGERAGELADELAGALRALGRAA